MPKKTSTMKVWITRDRHSRGAYNIYLNKPHDDYLVDKIWRSQDNYICHESFEYHFFKLKPGEGPVPVDITIKRRKK